MACKLYIHYNCQDIYIDTYKDRKTAEKFYNLFYNIFEATFKVLPFWPIYVETR